MNPRGSAWKPDATGTRCLRCARTWAGHAGRSCYAVPCAAIDSYDPPRPDLLVTDGDPSLALQAGRIDGEGEVLRDADGRPRICEWCPKPIPARSPTGRRTRADATTCGVICRKRRHRFQRAVARGVPLRVTARRDAERLTAGPGRFAYADPPYPGLADYYPEAEEVDHAALIAFLEAEYADGWALSTSARALREVLALCPAQTRVCAWRRRVRFTASRRALSAWEPLLVVRGRELATDRPQELVDDVQTPDVILDEDALDYRGRYDSAHRAMVGMKPPQFAVWMFGQLGARHGDTLDDLYPGSGSIGRAWTLYGALEAADASRLEPAEASRLAAAICPESPATSGGTDRRAGADASHTATAGPRDSS